MSHSDQTVAGQNLHSQTVVILAPTPQDAHVCGNILRDVEIESQFCRTFDEFCGAIVSGAGAGLIAEEHLDIDEIESLSKLLSSQPAWSDVPVIVLLKAEEHSSQTIERMLSIGHVTLVYRPLRIAVFVNTLRARLRDRARQYTVRKLLAERERSIESSRQDARRIEMALRAGGMGAWEFRGDRTYWSQKMFELLGYPNETKPTEEAIFQRVHPDDLADLTHKWTESTTKGEGFHHEFRIDHPVHGVRWLATVGEAITSKSGKLLRHAGLTWDITQRRQFEHSLHEARRQAEVANQSKSEFLANMSHEIRTPMSAILGYAEILGKHLQDLDDLKCVEIIRENGRFLLEIINDILDISKIEAGKLEVAKKRFRIDQLISDVRNIMDIRAAEKSLKFAIELDGNIPQEILSDSKRLKQILVNLIGNACKFTESGSINLRVHLPNGIEGEIIQFDVIDTGIGMTAEQQSRLFQPFMQADAAVDREYGGTGLGLAISKRLAEMLGGGIHVESEKGKGSKFSFTIATGPITGIPLIKESAFADMASEKHMQQHRATINGRILVVDDRREIRFIAQHFIESRGGTVVTGENGQQAIDLVTESKSNGQSFDLVVIDMQMPVMDGYEATRRLRAAGFDKPIIALTAHAMEGDRDECLAAGCTDYITKPLDGTFFIKLLSEHLQEA